MGIGWRELLIILVIVVVIFGASRFKTIGKDLGEAIKGFKKGMKDEGGQGPSQDQVGQDEPDKKD